MLELLPSYTQRILQAICSDLSNLDHRTTRNFLVNPHRPVLLVRRFLSQNGLSQKPLLARSEAILVWLCVNRLQPRNTTSNSSSLTKHTRGLPSCTGWQQKGGTVALVRVHEPSLSIALSIHLSRYTHIYMKDNSLKPLPLSISMSIGRTAFFKVLKSLTLKGTMSFRGVSEPINLFVTT